MGADVRVRVLFVAVPEREAEVRQRIEAALRGGHLDGDGPDGRARWQVRSSEPRAVLPEESDHAHRLMAT